MNFILIGDEAQRRFGWKLFTAMRYRPSGEVERVHTSNADAYPLAGRKPRRDTPWSRQVLVRGEPYYANDAAGIRLGRARGKRRRTQRSKCHDGSRQPAAANARGVRPGM